MPKNPLTALKADLWGDFIISVLTALRKAWESLLDSFTK